MSKHRPVHFVQKSLMYFDDMIRADAEYVSVVCGVMNFAQCHAIWDDWVTERSSKSVRNDVGSVQ